MKKFIVAVCCAFLLVGSFSVAYADFGCSCRGCDPQSWACQGHWEQVKHERPAGNDIGWWTGFWKGLFHPSHWFEYHDGQWWECWYEEVWVLDWSGLLNSPTQSN